MNFFKELLRGHNTGMRIGELAALAEVNIQTVRFYEREGLLRAPVRTASGYRSYAERDLEHLHFIRLCQGLGFTLREIQQLIHAESSACTMTGPILTTSSARRPHHRYGRD
jgi:MerR family copper efflux transcriptional regulator